MNFKRSKNNKDTIITSYKVFTEKTSNPYFKKLDATFGKEIILSEK